MSQRLLIVDDSNESDNFLNHFFKNQNLYKSWDVFFCSKTQKKHSNIKYWKFEDLEKILLEYKSLYKYYLIIKSSDILNNEYCLDLLPQVIETPTLIGNQIVQSNQNESNNSIILHDKKSLYYKILRTSIFVDNNYFLKRFSYQYVNYLFIKKEEPKIKIDYVFPYVNSEDESWIKSYNLYKNLESKKIESENLKDSRYEKNYSTGLQRFRDGGLLKYSLRSVEQNLPFVNKVHIIVASKSQIPNWLNQDNIDVITHDEFIPKELLPTFSSSEIEMFLPFLPRVSEYFIYGNDDTFIMKSQKVHHWFYNKKPVTYSGVRPMVDNFTGDVFRHNDYSLVISDDVYTTNNKLCLDQQHCPQPYVLSKMKECFKKYEKQILASCTRFRENTKNLNQWIYLAYNAFNNYLYQKKRACYTSDLSKWNKDLDLTKYTCVCMNDSSEDLNSENLKLFIQRMEAIFPNKSKFEF